MSAWSHVRHGRACEEMHETILQTGNQKNIEQLDKVDHQYKQEERKKKGELPKVCSQIVLKTPLLGAHRQTRESVVREQTGTSSHEMDESL